MKGVYNMENNKLLKEWEYEFKDWIPQFGSTPIELIKSEDRSPSYEMNRFHVFKLENCQYAAVFECGCSCYEPGQADIDLHPTELSAIGAFEKWRSETPDLYAL